MIDELSLFATKLFNDTNAKLYLVGGGVRDMLLNIEPKDYDLEVFRITPEAFQQWLTENNYKFKIEPNSKFPVIRMIFNDNEIEVGFPRTENKTGSKHSDYEIDVNPNMTLTEASQRRDFTINAMYYCLRFNVFKGNPTFNQDLRNKELKVVNVDTFREDALRILRAMQFIARFEFHPTNVYLAINQEMIDELQSLDPTCIWQEFMKMIHKGTPKGIGMALDFLVALSNRFELFPIFNRMQHTNQSPEHHAEGDVFEHTKMVVKHIVENNKANTLYFLSALCHDMGKVETTKIKDGKITAYGHEKEHDEMIEFLRAIGTPKKLITQVIILVGKHMLNGQMKNNKWFKVADALHKHGLKINDFIVLKEADVYGSRCNDETKKRLAFVEMVEQLECLNIRWERLPNLINGNDILNVDKSVCGIVIGQLLREVREKQFQGQINIKSKAIEFVTRRINNMKKENR